MTLFTWLTVVGICLLGAMSPGPSLAVVLQQTLRGGRRNGIVCALFHGLGVGLYAMLSIAGVAAVIAASPTLFGVLQWGGALYLLWLGIRGLMARRGPAAAGSAAPGTANAARDGFLIVFLNPKIAVFFLALFSQVVGADTSLPARFGYAATAMLIDAAWYLSVAWLFSQPRWLAALRRHAVWVDRLFGAVLVALAGRLALGMSG